MSINTERAELAEVINRLLDNMSLLVTSQTGREGVQLRHQIGNIRSNYYTMIVGGTFSTELQACFKSAQQANAKLATFFIVHQGLFEEVPVGEFSAAVVQMAIIFCLSTESRIIATLKFTSRDDVELMLGKMRDIFDTARVLAADAPDTSAYQKLTLLAGSLIDHLSNVSRPLPRMIKFSLSASLPSLTLSQLLYYTAERSDEIVDENKIVHPAFCTREIRGLSV